LAKMQAAESMTDQPTRIDDKDAIELREVLGILRRNGLLVLTIAAIFGLVAGILSWALPKRYEASVVLSPVISQSGATGLGAASTALSQIGGFASLAGLVTPGAGSAKAEAVATLKSEVLTERYIRENGLLPILFSDDWDSKRKAWRVTNPRLVPTLWKGNRLFARQVRTIAEDLKTGMVTLTITWTDPGYAAKWANGLVTLTNEYLRDEAVAESERNILYLKEQAAKTNVVGLQDAIYSLMEGEIKKQMLARGSRDFVLKVIDPATVPERASSPRPILWTSMGLLVGLLVALLMIWVRAVF
jgi:hypothetical protein